MDETMVLREWTRAVAARLVYEASTLDASVTWLTLWEGQHDPNDVIAYTPDGKWEVRVREAFAGISLERDKLADGLVRPLTDYELSDQGKQQSLTPQPLLSKTEEAARALFYPLQKELLPLARAHIPALVVTVRGTPVAYTGLAVEEAFGTGPLVRTAVLSMSDDKTLQLRVSLLVGVTVADHKPEQ